MTYSNPVPVPQANFSIPPSTLPPAKQQLQYPGNSYYGYANTSAAPPSPVLSKGQAGQESDDRDTMESLRNPGMYVPAPFNTSASGFGIPTPRPSIYGMDELAVAEIAAAAKSKIISISSKSAPVDTSPDLNANNRGDNNRNDNNSSGDNSNGDNNSGDNNNNNNNNSGDSNNNDSGDNDSNDNDHNDRNDYNNNNNDEDNNNNDDDNNDNSSDTNNSNDLINDCTANNENINNSLSSAPGALGISLPGLASGHFANANTAAALMLAPLSLPGYDERSANRFQSHQHSQSEVSVPLGKAWTGIADNNTSNPEAITATHPAAGAYTAHLREIPALPLTPPQGSPCGSKSATCNTILSPAQGLNSVAPAWTGGYVPVPAQTTQVSASDFYSRLYADLRANGAAPIPFSLPPTNSQWMPETPDTYGQYLMSQSARAQTQQQQQMILNQLDSNEYQQLQPLQQMQSYQHPYSPDMFNTKQQQQQQQHAVCTHSPYSRTQSSSSNLSSHSSSGGRPRKYACAVCFRLFTRPSALQTHIYSHTGERPFVCPVAGCGRPFSVASNLRRHSKIHESCRR